MCAQKQSIADRKQAAHDLSAACIERLLGVDTTHVLPFADPKLAALMKQIEDLK